MNVSNASAVIDERQIVSAPATVSSTKKSPGAFRTISEVADEMNVPQHVLRFWETKFSQIRPLKRGGGRRYYRPEDVEIVRAIHRLLYNEGYTIKGAQKSLREKGKAATVADNPPRVAVSIPAERLVSSPLSDSQKSALRDIAAELRDLRRMIA
jgi:DNA-binding transcriptional MerR regulator